MVYCGRVLCCVLILTDFNFSIDRRNNDRKGSKNFSDRDFAHGLTGNVSSPAEKAALFSYFQLLSKINYSI